MPYTYSIDWGNGWETVNPDWYGIEHLPGYETFGTFNPPPPEVADEIMLEYAKEQGAYRIKLHDGEIVNLVQ